MMTLNQGNIEKFLILSEPAQIINCPVRIKLVEYYLSYCLKTTFPDRSGRPCIMTLVLRHPVTSQFTPYVFYNRYIYKYTWFILYNYITYKIPLNYFTRLIIYE